MRKTGLVLLFLALVATVASADTFYLNFQNGGINPALPAGTPYATVVVTQNGTAQVDFSITVAAGYKIGSDAFAFNVENSIPLSQISVTGLPTTTHNPGATLDWSYDKTAGNMDGFGSFDVHIKAFDGLGKAVSSLTFSVKRSTGTLTIADLYQMSAGNAGNGNGHFAAHVFPTATGGLTGYARDNPTTIPEPGTLVLLGTGLLGLARKLRR